ncbi:MAG: ribosomal protein S12 methylthiotransferase RimO [Candidatus Schekmanbacteria bacterium RBG_16_38_10]|uniref:Ribosomal protein uS12 methylthiotransferase RimO n=1 Tax=Candidatus Schekmanbacteria bacterium RBG_16_38_10 TaxID=1817879 RepID=A0A1F7RZN1_9BACT|nr:MAG: ribosomal protein S12 methylthiotransferase RimO [Candidatus Schekmanbacteria bacterium RBG_16_38_10]
MPKVSFISLGCPKNLVDSEVLLGNLSKDGFAICENYEDSDVVIINTCSFLKESEDESIGVIEDALKLRNEGKVKAVVVTGCLPQRYGPAIAERLNRVDGILGITNRDTISKLCSDILRQKTANTNTPLPTRSLVSADLPKYEVDRDRLRLTPRHFAYIRLSEGCDHTCAFCIIPQIRGKFRSKPMEVILDEVRELADDGAVELNLIAQDTTMYGLDIYRRLALPELLDKISNIDGVKWIRLLYCYPTFVTDKLIKTIAENPKVVKYIDLPIQHTKEKILRLMRRGITETRQKELIESLRKNVPNIFIRTTIIVGFPGEADNDFNQLANDIEEFQFERLGTFRYSEEKGTRAYDMEGKVPDEEKEKRFNHIMALQQRIAFKKNRELIGKKVEVIVDNRVDGLYEGRTYGDAPDVDGTIFIKSNQRIDVGKIYNAHVTDTQNYDLVGSIK